jgi:hypothetical protein
MDLRTRLYKVLTTERHIAPLAVLRIAFGAILFISTIRFIGKGWVDEFYVRPTFHFPFYGFEWVTPFPAAGMHIVFGLMLLAALFITIGLWYRRAVAVFLLCFIYVELLDKTYYLNHYYFVTIFTFLLLFVPAGRYFSVDGYRKPSLKAVRVPAWTILILQVQLFLVYFLAGLSKLTPDWMLEALPLRIWLPANSELPVIGSLLAKTWVAYAFSWFGAVFDLSIGALLWNGRTRKIAYVFVVLFHVLTALLFKIGMFPYIMIAATLAFFPAPKKLDELESGRVWRLGEGLSEAAKSGKRKAMIALLGAYFFVQILLPFRFLFYPGRLFWTEQGYRFSWRVMLMEKNGTCFFYITDPATGRRGEVDNSKFLTSFQERQMATQPDMLLQYAHHLYKVFGQKGIKDPIVTVESYVTLNGSGSRLYIDSTVNLATQKENLLPKTWILPFQQKK